jgi:hypothetical protein
MARFIAVSTTLTFRIGIIDITSLFSLLKFQLCWRTHVYYVLVQGLKDQGQDSPLKLL